MSTSAHYRMFAAYNRWCNERLYAAAAKLSPEEYRTDCGVFFGSMHGTLNHLLATDRIWMKRLTGSGEAPNRLDAILHEELAPLRDARQAEDARISAFIDGLDDDGLARVIVYHSLTNPAEIRQVTADALAHVFNHQTHHRGQAHSLLTILGGRDAAPSFDLVMFQRLRASGQA